MMMAVAYQGRALPLLWTVAKGKKGHFPEHGHVNLVKQVQTLIPDNQAHDHYKKRFRIETFFPDQKSRGFHIRHSHLSEPARWRRLLIATCLAYYWIVCLGDHVVRNGWTGIVHRKDRCDLGLFRLGME